MNTPRSKPPVRYQPTADDMLPPGTYTSGIHDADIAADVCRIITEWPQIEEYFIPLFAHLADIADANNARIVFRTIRAQDARLKIMTAMLEKSPVHADKTAKYDELIAEFKSINGMRNDYAHGMWLTEDIERKVYLASDLDNYFGHGVPRVVLRSETTGILDRTRKLLFALLENRKALALSRALRQPKEQP